jgi:HSP20 family protein
MGDVYPAKGFYENNALFLSMKSDSSSTSDLERMIGKAAVEAARMSSQASQAAKKFLSEAGSETTTKGYDIPAIDLIEGNEMLTARVALPGISKSMIDLRVTEDTFSVEGKATPKEGKYLRREMSSLGFKREIKLPMEIKPEQVKATFENGILEVQLPKLVVVNAQKVQVD